VSYGEYHPLPPRPPKEKYVLGLSLFETGILLLGLMGAEKLLKVIPSLPVNNFILSKIHAAVPLVIAVFFAFGRHPKTNLPIGQEVINWLEFRMRKKTLEFGRSQDQS